MQTSSATNRASRITSIDILRGVIMVIMALDHTRDFFEIGGWSGDPTNLATTTAAMFMTRWFTHFCAPVFVLLAGTSIYFQRRRGKSISELSRFLFTRGVWLVVVEISLVGFGWSFDIGFHTLFLQVFWAIGIAMICMSVMIRLPLRWIGAIGALIVCGHNALDGIHIAPDSAEGVAWSAMHAQGFYVVANYFHVVFFYPVLAWIGVMALGYVFGRLYDSDISSERRRQILLKLGSGGIALFLMLRAWNVYGDPLPWSPQSTGMFSALSFLNTEKYPPSLLFLLMTLAPAMLFLRMIDRGAPKMFKPFVTYGRVPLFYYLAHIYALHVIEFGVMLVMGFSWSAIVAGIGTRNPIPSAFGFELPGVYLVWACTVVVLFPLCVWYDRYKSMHRTKWWLSYL